jgi:outer membrane lipoprotein-sorting protein
MRTIILSFSLLFFTFTGAFPQNDPEAVKILDRFSAAALGAPSISMKFDLVTVDQVEGTTNTNSGSIILNRDKYKLDLTDNIIWYNGETSWNYLPDEKEVTITKPEKDDDSFQTRPSAVFSLYKKGYKSRLIEKKADSFLIDIYPEEMESDHIRIRLSIGSEKLDLKSLEYKYKNGVTLTLKVKEYDLSRKPDDSEFAFSIAKYKGIEIVDMR